MHLQKLGKKSGKSSPFFRPIFALVNLRTLTTIFLRPKSSISRQNHNTASLLHTRLYFRRATKLHNTQLLMLYFNKKSEFFNKLSINALYFPIPKSSTILVTLAPASLEDAPHKKILSLSVP